MSDTDTYREIISRILSTGHSPADVQKIKLEFCREYGIDMPRNSAILAAASAEERELLRHLLQVKPTRTLSGVAPVAVMTSPHPCPHGRCLPCPGGPEHPFGSPQSYTGEEPAALRAREHGFDPYAQVQARLGQFEALGHHIEKAEVIVMGGTITARPIDYQEWFVGAAVQAMNDYPRAGTAPAGPDLDAIAASNESARVRCVAITFETRPDWCLKEHINRMLGMGVTKVELGVQHLDDRILEYNRRGHTVAETVAANGLLRDAGLKVGFHVMPNLPGASMADDRRMFEDLFADERFRPDFLKIYPTLVTPGTEIEALWERGEYQPYTEDELIDLVAYAKSLLPEYVRLQRIQRDIPARLITAGSRHSNFRQLAGARLREQGGRCRCIRCREAGRSPAPEEVSISTLVYRACGGEERFIQAGSKDTLIGFARLRFPQQTFREELTGAALLRELHVYGSLVPISTPASPEEWQHRSYGAQLLSRAEEEARDHGCRRIAVMSGVGVRPYYRKQGYERVGPYMIKTFP
ncbi:tRNA uridine(34) 5-carboxymethylaminomethyl modification radical SAM/GNAT enzyme Elp3 [Methanoculleus receptaculi]|jgi:elongator complex protein 3|uniref:tRNA carboxymethyluridine synthase n=1 Tax=Methanoculleus receptaculi TaxID=394967 RepID=A0AAX4FV69_9EURY|nr:tRNA uridine(34) 5-carboxymethylaminomethyl modification radical SAM/GNAT enzyme Elp3 [Methanoculleus receptaculi]WOX57777.1 tRNA uridine(34) 5-carboxymethylaminomethyl modification radical SAM/GNAT enzyme Elp3 [Methanoculleus receptaculi]